MAYAEENLIEERRKVEKERDIYLIALERIRDEVGIVDIEDVNVTIIRAIVNVALDKGDRI
jgi:hypothetical protein